jgi:hypothetical protein
MRELDADGEPIKASTYNYRAKGYDGFLGYGYDEESGDCCEDCICNDECEKIVDVTTFEIRAYWFEDCKDLDMQVKLYDKSGGFDCLNNSSNGGRYSFDCLNSEDAGHQICWIGDDTSTQGVEVFFIKLDWNKFEEDAVVYNGSNYFKLEVFAHWFEPAYKEGCSNNFDFFAQPCGVEPYSLCSAGGEENTPFIEKAITGYNIIGNGCSSSKITTLYINKNEILSVWVNGVNAVDFDPRERGRYYIR